ncbi:hypothetical protein EON80_05280, partial [bacterium]
MKSLRTQLLASHLALVALMALVMVGAIINFFRLGASIDHILRDNYQSVVAAQNMKESLERQDSAATLFLAGQPEKARAQWKTSVVAFDKALADEQANITEEGERPVAQELEQNYQRYRGDMAALLAMKDESAAKKRYLASLEPQFLRIKSLAQQVLEINQSAILRADARAKREAQNGALVGSVMTLAALALAIWFARAAINSALTPLLALVQ